MKSDSLNKFGRPSYSNPTSAVLGVWDRQFSKIKPAAKSRTNPRMGKKRGG